jgi:ribonuclease III
LLRVKKGTGSAMGFEKGQTLPIDTDSLAELESRIGYRFRDRGLLCRALTHSSYSNETGQRNHHLLCNERLEFLGDSVLSLVVSEYLFKTYRNLPEGDLTCLRKDVVCADALAGYARRIGLGSRLLLGVGEEKTGGRDKVNILADAFEALLAAVFVDAGGGGDAKNVIAGFLLPFVQSDLNELESNGGDGDYKTPLQQLIQQTEGDVLEYVLIREDGPDHMKTFEVEARLNSNVIGRGVGRSKRKAEQAAARDALNLFGVK